MKNTFFRRIHPVWPPYIKCCHTHHPFTAAFASDPTRRKLSEIYFPNAIKNFMGKINQKVVPKSTTGISFIYGKHGDKKASVYLNGNPARGTFATCDDQRKQVSSFNPPPGPSLFHLRILVFGGFSLTFAGNILHYGYDFL